MNTLNVIIGLKKTISKLHKELAQHKYWSQRYQQENRELRNHIWKLENPGKQIPKYNSYKFKKPQRFVIASNLGVLEVQSPLQPRPLPRNPDGTINWSHIWRRGPATTLATADSIIPTRGPEPF